MPISKQLLLCSTLDSCVNAVAWIRKGPEEGCIAGAFGLRGLDYDGLRCWRDATMIRGMNLIPNGASPTEITMTFPDGSRQGTSGDLPPMGTSARRDRMARRDNIVWGVVSAIVGVFLLGLAYHGLAGRRYMTAAGPSVLIDTTPATAMDQAPTVTLPRDAR